MRTRAAVWTPFILLALACGGPPAPATSPDATTPGGHDPAQPDDGSETEAKSPAAKSDVPVAADKAASSAPASSDDVSAILQLVVDDPELDNYLHLGEAGRFPVKMSGDTLPTGLKLVKATKPVEIVDGPKSKKDAVIAISDIDVQGDRATVRYRYDIENIRATVTLAKSPHGWELKNSRLVEH